jgi:hypothetical protein
MEGRSGEQGELGSESGGSGGTARSAVANWQGIFLSFINRQYLSVLPMIFFTTI